MRVVASPIVPNARFEVRCDCGLRFDSAAKTPDAAIDEATALHPDHSDFTAARVDYTKHPAFTGVFEHEDRADRLVFSGRTAR